MRTAPTASRKRVMHFSDKRTHKCHDCRQRFSIKVGTIFEDTKLPLRKWFAAIWLITSHKKGIASTQLAKDLKITQKSAWFVLHRLRYAAKTKSFDRPLEGMVEIDESYFGGKDHNKHATSDRKQGARARRCVFGLVERGGEIRAGTITNLNARMVRGRVVDNVKPGTPLMTDEHARYKGLSMPAYPIWSVNHSKGEYVALRLPHQHAWKALGACSSVRCTAFITMFRSSTWTPTLAKCAIVTAAATWRKASASTTSWPQSKAA